MKHLASPFLAVLTLTVALGLASTPAGVRQLIWESALTGGAVLAGATTSVGNLGVLARHDAQGQGQMTRTGYTQQ